MAAALEDVADPTDPTLIFVHEWWPVGGDPIPKLGLHLHGDDAARAESAYLLEAIESLRNPDEPLTLPELDSRMRSIAEARGLKAIGTKTRCAADPLEVAIDLSVWQAP
jgi:hypothetical protein